MSCMILDSGFYTALHNEIAGRIFQASKYLDANEGTRRALCQMVGVDSNIFVTVSDKTIKEKVANFINRLRELNYVAFAGRYAENYESPATLVLRMAYTQELLREQLLKAMQCVAYQLSESATREASERTALLKAINSIALAFIEDTPDYRNAGWDKIETVRTNRATA